MLHELKIYPDYFKAVIERRKTFEVRRNDRDFKVGDEVVLREYDPYADKYTGRIWYGDITYILDNDLYCKRGLVIMSIVEKKKIN